MKSQHITAMPDEPDWVTAAITKARQQGDGVPAGVWAQLDTLLRGLLSERPLPAKEVAAIARDLLARMEPTQTKAVGLL